MFANFTRSGNIANYQSWLICDTICTKIFEYIFPCVSQRYLTHLADRNFLIHIYIKVMKQEG